MPNLIRPQLSDTKATFSKIINPKIIITLIITGFVLLTTVASLPVLANSLSLADKTAVDENEQTVSTIIYKPNSKIEDVIKDLKGLQKDNIKINSLTSKFKVNNQEITDFVYSGNINETLDQTKEDLKLKRFELIKNVQVKNKDLNNLSISKNSPVVNTDIINLEEISKQDVIITESHLTGKKAKLDTIKSKFKTLDTVSEIKVKNIKNKEKPNILGNLFGTIKASASYEYGIPKGTISYFGNGGLANEDIGSTRYNFNYMYWDTNNFGYNETYEHEVYLYNSAAEGTYLATDNSWGYPNCYANTKYASTTLPSAYLDTRLDQNSYGQSWCDNDTNYGREVSYTIGTTRAVDITANQWQWTYMSLNRGSRNIPVFKTQAQIGYNSPDRWTGFPSSTWTSFGYNGGTHRLIYDRVNNNFITNPTLVNAVSSQFSESYFR
jgi:hypothetical protein